MEGLDFLKLEIDKRIKSLDSKRIYYRKIAFRVNISIAFIAAISTIILGLELNFLEDFSRIIVLFLTGLISIINAYSTFYDHKSLWVSNNDVLNLFYALRFDIEFQEKSKKITDEDVLNFKNRYQKIINTYNESWSKVRN